MKLTEAYALLKKELGKGHYSIDCETWDRGKGITVEFTVWARPFDEEPHDSYSESDSTLDGAVQKLIKRVIGDISEPNSAAENFVSQAEMADSSGLRDRETALAEDAQDRNEQDRIDRDRDRQDAERERE